MYYGRIDLNDEKTDSLHMLYANIHISTLVYTHSYFIYISFVYILTFIPDSPTVLANVLIPSFRRH